MATEITLEALRNYTQGLSDNQLMEIYQQSNASNNMHITNLLSILLRQRQEVSALREKYPREVLEKMSYEELEKLLWEEVLGKYPAWLTKELLQDIFEIQDSKTPPP